MNEALRIELGERAYYYWATGFPLLARELAVGYRIEPLSGTWAGESIPEISERYDLDLFDSELADKFEEGFYDI